jgi:hypothetical protein
MKRHDLFPQKNGCSLIMNRGFFSFVVILISSVLVAGCTLSPSAPGIPTGTTAAPMTPTAPPLTVSPISITQIPGQIPVDCNRTIPSGNKKPFITINPVPHHYFGESIRFDGTTTLQPGESLETAVYSGEFSPCPKSIGNCRGNVTPCCGGYSATVFVLAGTCSINTWSWDVNTKEHGFRPDGLYIISAIGRNGAVENYSFFTVSGIPQPNLTLNLPENDPDEYAIQLSGQANTGNGPDEKLLLTVSSDSDKEMSFMVPVFQNGTGYFWNFTLNKSKIVPYNFYSVNITSNNTPEIRIFRTFLYNNEPSYYPYTPHSS